MGKKRKLRKLMRKRGLEDETALVICVGKKCCAREEAREVLEASTTYAAQAHPDVHVVAVACLDVCKKGPVAAMYPDEKFKKRVTPKRARKLLDKLAARHT